VEETLRSTGQAEIEAQEVGMAILAPLRELDEVAYLRYASVYRNFASLEDFEGEIALLRAMPSSHSPATSNKSNSPITEKSTTAAPQSNKTLINQNN
jgi:transcriptional repressor NrdR